MTNGLKFYDGKGLEIRYKDMMIGMYLLKTLGWISLEEQIPPKGTIVDWYDAMFDEIHTFAMDEPSNHDGDYVYWRIKDEAK